MRCVIQCLGLIHAPQIWLHLLPHVFDMDALLSLASSSSSSSLQTSPVVPRPECPECLPSPLQVGEMESRLLLAFQDHLCVVCCKSFVTDHQTLNPGEWFTMVFIYKVKVNLWLLFFLKVELIYVVLVSGVQQSGSILCIYHLSTFIFRSFFIIDYYKILNIVPCTRQ